MPPKAMQCSWLGERVAQVDVFRAINNVICEEEDAGWGPNATFRFPQAGGTGSIWKAVACRIPEEKKVKLSKFKILSLHSQQLFYG